MLERFERFTFTVYEIQRLWNKIASDEMMDGFELRGSFVIYIIALRRCPDGLTAAQLGAMCARDKADVSRSVAVMTSKGLIEKEPGASSYRAKLRLTEQGRKVAEVIAYKASIAEETVGKGLEPNERESLYSALDKIRGNLRKLCKTGIVLPEEGETDAEECSETGEDL